ncbi:hypothetical protein [Amycolatopsis sp. GM8]|uniref:hypothetical protein n=1 Tax=Amycolatopsis sp. GM8 TaxID=2896530 RepID=UPI001F15D8F4|nr:hypothetical protein [Amycolatopsis sp. GM8]
MPIPTDLSRLIRDLRVRAGGLAERARTETSEQLARFSGRGAAWVDEAGDLLAERAATAGARFTEAAAERGARLSTGVAATVDRWSGNLANRMVHLGEELSRPRD